MPTGISVTRHARRFRADEHLRALARGFRGEKRVKPHAIEDPADARVGENDLGVVRSFKDDVGDAAGDPVGAVRVRKLTQSGIADALGATDRRAHRKVAFQQDDVQLGSGLLGAQCRDRAGRPGPDDEDVDIRHE